MPHFVAKVFIYRTIIKKNSIKETVLCHGWPFITTYPTIAKADSTGVRAWRHTRDAAYLPNKILTHSMMPIPEQETTERPRSYTTNLGTRVG